MHVNMDKCYVQMNNVSVNVIRSLTSIRESYDLIIFTYFVTVSFPFHTCESYKTGFNNELSIGVDAVTVRPYCISVLQAL